MFPFIRPSRKAQSAIKGEIKNLTCRRTLALPKEVVIQKLNEAVRGWVGYFYYGNCSKDFSALRRFLEERVRIYLRRKHQKKSRGYKAYPNKYLYETLGTLQDTDDGPMDSSCESRRKKMIGKPYSGKLNVRFDEGELEIEPRPLRQFPTLPFEGVSDCFS